MKERKENKFSKKYKVKEEIQYKIIGMRKTLTKNAEGKKNE